MLLTRAPYDSPMSSNSRNGIIAAVVVAIALIAGGAWWYLRDDSPDAVDQETAASSVAENADDAAPDVDDLTGTWAVDTASGEFDFETATGTFAGVRIEEELSSIGSTTAVGRTGDVSGTVGIDGTTVDSTTVEVDLTTVTTNESRRDDKVQQALETDQFPTATFELTEPIDLGPDPTSGDAVTADAVGTMTIHGQTQPVTVPIQAQLVGDTIVLTGSVDVTFSDYGVEVPSAPIVLSVSDVGTVEMQLLLTRS